jgi:hypothetical protein
MFVASIIFNLIGWSDAIIYFLKSALPPASKTFFNLLEVMPFFDLLEVIRSSRSDSYLLPLLLQLEGTTSM